MFAQGAECRHTSLAYRGENPTPCTERHKSPGCGTSERNGLCGPALALALQR